MAGVEGLVDGGEYGGGGSDCCFFDGRSSPMPATVVPAVLDGFGWGFLCELGHHFYFLCRKREREREREIGGVVDFENNAVSKIFLARKTWKKWNRADQTTDGSF